MITDIDSPFGFNIEGIPFTMTFLQLRLPKSLAIYVKELVSGVVWYGQEPQNLILDQVID